MRFVLIYIFLSFLSFPLWTQSFNFQNYSVREGVAQSKVAAVLVDSRGFVWLGTQGGGLSRFDGREFTTLSTREGLPGNQVHAVWEDAQGMLWIGTDKGLATYDGRQVKNWSERQIDVRSIEQDSSGKIWIGTTAGLYTLAGNGLKRLSAPARTVHAILTDQSGQTWLATKQGLWALEGGIPRYRAGQEYEMTALAEGKDGLLYIGTASQQLYIWNGNGLSPFIGNRQLPAQTISSLRSTPDGGIWIGTSANGLFRWDIDVGTLTRLNTKDGLADEEVLAMDQDPWGNWWFGTGRGVSCYGGQLFDFYSRQSGLDGDAVYAIQGAENGGMLFALDEKGLFRKTDTTFQSISYRGWRRGQINTIFRDPNQHLWLGSEGNGLAMIYQDSCFYVGNDLGFNSQLVRSIVADSSGTLWVATVDVGLYQLDMEMDSFPRFELINWSAADGLAGYRINQVHIDRQDRLWLATEDAGLLCWRKGALLYAIDENMGLPKGQLTALAEDPAGYLWVGTAKEGLARVEIYADSIGVTTYTDANGLYSNNINLLLLDEEENLWIGTEAGVDRMQLDADRAPKTIQHFGRSEGFLGVETIRNATYKDSLGNLYFGTVAGLAKFNANYSSQGDQPPSIVLTDIQLFGQSLQATPYGQHLGPWFQPDTVLVFPHDENNLGFAFLGLEQSQAAKVRYQYWLEGWDEDWSAETENREKVYANLRPGAYTFWVKSLHLDSKLATEPLAIPFYIEAPWWEHPWLKPGLAILGLLLILWIFRSQIKRIRRKAQAEQVRLSMEKHVLELEQKALQLQMNPHFIFNALNSIQLLIAKKDEKTARSYLAKFSRLMRATLENARQPKILLAEEIESLERYLSLEQFSRGDRFAYQIEVRPEEEADEVFIPPMMVQPFVENAIIHGVSALKEGGRVEVLFEVGKEEVICTIQDNGIGIAESQRQKDNTTHQSVGLQVTKERLELLQPQRQVLEIGPKPGDSRGTLVKIHLPLL